MHLTVFSVNWDVQIREGVTVVWGIEPLHCKIHGKRILIANEFRFYFSSPSIESGDRYRNKLHNRPGFPWLHLYNVHNVCCDSQWHVPGPI